MPSEIRKVSVSTFPPGCLGCSLSVERETGIEPATSSLGKQPWIVNTEFSVYGVNCRRS
jgi:hypothetical protein